MKESKVMFEIAKSAEKKGFKTRSVTTCFTNIYLLGGKKTLINDTCILLWMCELQKWLRDLPTPIIITPTTDFVSWEVEILHPDKGLKTITMNREGKWFDSHEEALEIGLQEALKLIPNK